MSGLLTTTAHDADGDRLSRHDLVQEPLHAAVRPCPRQHCHLHTTTTLLTLVRARHAQVVAAVQLLKLIRLATLVPHTVDDLRAVQD